MAQAGMDDLKKVKRLWTRHGLLCINFSRFAAVMLSECGERRLNVEMVFPVATAVQLKT